MGGEKILAQGKKKKARWAKEAPDGRAKKPESKEDAGSKSEGDQTSKASPNKKEGKRKAQIKKLDDDQISRKRSKKSQDYKDEKDFNSIVNKYMEKLSA